MVSALLRRGLCSNIAANSEQCDKEGCSVSSAVKWAVVLAVL